VGEIARSFISPVLLVFNCQEQEKEPSLGCAHPLMCHIELGDQIPFGVKHRFDATPEQA
jgi:hypothetical protein